MESQENGEDSNLLMPELPFELIIFILLRLPVKSLSRFKCVSKSWLSLISSPQFIKDHLHAFSLSEDTQNLQLLSGGIDGADYCFYLTDCSITSLLSEQQPTNAIKDEIGIDHPPILRLSHRFMIVGCCNGLLCIHCYKNGILLCNPSTRKSQNLPSFCSPKLELLMQEDYYDVYGFGYDKVSDDYKVVKIVCSYDADYNHSGTEVIVYSFKAGSWKSIGEFPGSWPTFGVPGSFVNGKLHWISAGWENSVVFLDLATETFGCLDLAIERNGGVGGVGISHHHGFSLPVLGTFGGNLGLICQSYRDFHVELWVMKEYRVGESWTKVVSIQIDKKISIFEAIYIPGNERLLVVLENEMRLYNMNDNSFSILSRFDNRYVLKIYVESLVSLDLDSVAKRQQ